MDSIAIPAIKLMEWTVGRCVARRKLDTQSCVDRDDETGPRPSELMVVIVDNGVARQSCSVGTKNRIETKNLTKIDKNRNQREARAKTRRDIACAQRRAPMAQGANGAKGT